MELSPTAKPSCAAGAAWAGSSVFTSRSSSGMTGRDSSGWIFPPLSVTAAGVAFIVAVILTVADGVAISAIGDSGGGVFVESSNLLGAATTVEGSARSKALNNT